MSDSNRNYSGGISFFSLLSLLLIALKLTGYIEWSWWLVLLPFYGPLVVAIALVILAIKLD